ncbi:MAG TPA: glycosyltransferase family 39 protein [Candidatus Acidoferrum sp.]|nr:glycosyltransferase family 39 protein [Candidatus Acidoferrum sp.]
MENSDNWRQNHESVAGSKSRFLYLVVLLITGAIYLGCIISPPSLMDDVDAVQAQIARNMLSSGDWITAHIDGVVYLEKAPLIYWIIAGFFKVFGAHDWVARIPIALSAIALAWLTAAFGTWAFGKRAGFYAGLCMGTGIGLFLFTRILIPDVMLTFTITLSMWSFLRALDQEEPRPRLWALLMAASIGVGLLLKSLIGVVFPVAAALIYLLATKQLFVARTWQRLHLLSGTVIALAIAAPWHILATLRNPPYFVFTFHSGPGQYHGFLWFYFMNEQVLRFLNLRYPRDYNTVPRLWFWLFHFLWLFPWSVYFPAVAKLSFEPLDRGGKTRLLALCWAGFMLIFFTFSTTQEYYSMPCYPALALLLGSAMAAGGAWIHRGTRALSAIAALAAISTAAIFYLVRNVPAPGDISSALGHHPGAYTLSLGHMEDLTLTSFAYLRLPLVLASVAFFVGALGTFFWEGKRAFLATSVMMVIFFHAARVAMVAFDPFLSSRPLAEAIRRSPEGKLIVDHHYYTFSSVFFYLNRDGLLLNGKFHNLEYGAAAPNVPPVFITDSDFVTLWNGPERCYIVADHSATPRLSKLVGHDALNGVIASGGKLVLTNQAFPGTFLLGEASVDSAHLESGSEHLHLRTGAHP